MGATFLLWSKKFVKVKDAANIEEKNININLLIDRCGEIYHVGPHSEQRCVRLCAVTMPTCLSMLKMRLLEPSSYSLDRTSFSTPNTTPSLQRMAIAVLHRHTEKQTVVVIFPGNISTVCSAGSLSTEQTLVLTRTSLVTVAPTVGPGDEAAGRLATARQISTTISVL